MMLSITQIDGVTIEIAVPGSISGPTGPAGLTGAVGPAGPTGATGPPGNPTFIFNQNVPLNVWTINHDLGTYPPVVVVDSAGRVVEGDLFYASPNTLIVSFSGGFSGVAYLK